MVPLGIGGVSPNIILCFIIVFAFLFDNYQCFVFSIIFGILHDFCFSETIGVATISYFLVALGVYGIHGFVNKENRLSVILAAIGGTLLYSLIFWSASTVFGASYSIIAMLRVQPIFVLYNAVIVMIFYTALIGKVVRHRDDNKFKGKFISYE